jgi:hypothetical protein
LARLPCRCPSASAARPNPSMIASPSTTFNFPAVRPAGGIGPRRMLAQLNKGSQRPRRPSRVGRVPDGPRRWVTSARDASNNRFL